MIEPIVKILITGSSGLIGSTAAGFFLHKGDEVFGIDNNQRKKFFGNEGTTYSIKKQLLHAERYHHFNIDITNKKKIEELFQTHNFDAIIHCAAQPSHDRAKDFPFLDFTTNAVATVWLLEMTRTYCPKAVFIFTSTNKVYGDNPNLIPLVEKEQRYWFKDEQFSGISESCSLDHCTHSLFGAGKVSADIYVQEYGRYFGMKTACLRLGCVTGVNHAGVKEHGFLSYLVKKAVTDGEYTIIGYKGKQVRDQIDAQDVVLAMQEIINKPVTGEAFNLGGGKENAASILELLALLQSKLGSKIKTSYLDEARVGDHICYVTDFSKFVSFYPNWKITKSLPVIVEELIKSKSAH